MSWSVQRKEPYTAAGIRRLKCVRCGDKAEHQWQICSDGNNFRPICTPCDVGLNKAALEFMKHPDAKGMHRRYASAKGVKP